ncbi:MAG: hypothetical protein ABMA13_06525 [Chthoniobacteraceae bacterium]
MLAPRAAAWFGALLLAVVTVVVAFTILDHPKAATLESFSQTSAVGDVEFYVPPDPPLAVPEPVLTWQGRAWAPANYDKAKIDDPEMQRVAIDEASGLTIYQPLAKGAAGGHFIKIAIGEYLRIEPR